MHRVQPDSHFAMSRDVNSNDPDLHSENIDTEKVLACLAHVNLNGLKYHAGFGCNLIFR